MKNNIFIKIIAIILILTLGIQEIGFTEVYNLREVAGTGDYAGAVLQGLVMSLIMPAFTGNAGQMFVRTYLVPEGARQIIKMAGVKDESTQIILSTVASVFVNSLLDYGASGSAEAQAENQASGGKGFFDGVSKTFSNLFKFFKDNAAVSGAIINGVVAGLMVGVAMYAKKILKKSKKDVRPWIEFMVDVASLYLGNFLSVSLQKAFKVYLSYDKDKGPTAQKMTDKAQLAEALKKSSTEFNQRMMAEIARLFLEALGKSIRDKKTRGIATALGAGLTQMLLAKKGQDSGKAFWEGLKLGFISAALQYLYSDSSEGPMYSLLASGILHYLLIKKDNVKEITGFDAEGNPILSEGKKGWMFFFDLLSAAGNNAVARFMSGGRARYKPSGGKLDFEWESGNDVFYLKWYSDYVKMVVEKGLYAAVTSQLAASFHYQAVAGFNNIISGYVNKATYLYDLTGPERLERAFKTLVEKLGKEKVDELLKKTKAVQRTNTRRGVLAGILSIPTDSVILANMAASYEEAILEGCATTRKELMRQLSDTPEGLERLKIVGQIEAIDNFVATYRNLLPPGRTVILTDVYGQIENIYNVEGIRRPDGSLNLPGVRFHSLSELPEALSLEATKKTAKPTEKMIYEKMRLALIGAALTKTYVDELERAEEGKGRNLTQEEEALVLSEARQEAVKYVDDLLSSNPSGFQEIVTARAMAELERAKITGLAIGQDLYGNPTMNSLQGGFGPRWDSVVVPPIIGDAGFIRTPLPSITPVQYSKFVDLMIGWKYAPKKKLKKKIDEDEDAYKKAMKKTD